MISELINLNLCSHKTVLMYALRQPLQRPFQDFVKRASKRLALLTIAQKSTDLSKPRNGFANNCLNDKKRPGCQMYVVLWCKTNNLKLKTTCGN